MDLVAPLGGVYQAGTLSGNPLAMEAGLQTLRQTQAPGFYETLEARTEGLLAAVRDHARRRSLPIAIPSCASFFNFFFGAYAIESAEELKGLDKQAFVRFYRHLYANGVYAPPSQYEAWFLSSAHSDGDIAQTSELLVAAMDKAYA